MTRSVTIVPCAHEIETSGYLFSLVGHAFAPRAQGTMVTAAQPAVCSKQVRARPVNFLPESTSTDGRNNLHIEARAIVVCQLYEEASHATT